MVRQEIAQTVLGSSLPDWADQRYQTVVVFTRDFINRHISNRETNQLLHTALLEANEQYHLDSELIPAVHLPLLVYAAIKDDDQASLPLAVVTYLFDLGIYLLDHLADRELSNHWQGYAPTQIQLAAIGLISALPQLAIGELDSDATVIAAMQKSMSQALIRIGQGQQLDLELTGNNTISLEQIERSVADKTGERRAFFAVLAAQFAQADADTCEAYAKFGREYGIMRQLLSDCYDLFKAAISSDLRNGTRTWPIGWLLSRLQGDELHNFQTLLDQAKSDNEAQVRVREILRQHGVLRRTWIQIDLHRQRALQALEKANPLEPTGSTLKAMVNELSSFQN